MPWRLCLRDTSRALAVVPPLPVCQSRFTKLLHNSDVTVRSINTCISHIVEKDVIAVSSIQHIFRQINAMGITHGHLVCRS
jgi:hypothetical protein